MTSEELIEEINYYLKKQLKQHNDILKTSVYRDQKNVLSGYKQAVEEFMEFISEIE
jgi:hypothetical protein